MNLLPKLNYVASLVIIVSLLCFTSCNNLFDDIYDKPSAEDEKKDFGFIEIDNTNHSGTIYIDATDYTQWVYINFHNLTTDTKKVDEVLPADYQWDIAVHRYDTKTNSASVIETGFTGLSTLKASGKIPEGSYVEDVWEEQKVAIDMSGMLEGNIKYLPSFYNQELSKWLFVDTSGMPPTYTPSNKVYVIKLKDNTYAGIRLSNFMNAEGVKGFMTINYIYPLEF